jgi:hypothetical protein
MLSEFCVTRHTRSVAVPSNKTVRGGMNVPKHGP